MCMCDFDWMANSDWVGQHILWHAGWLLLTGPNAQHLLLLIAKLYKPVLCRPVKYSYTYFKKIKPGQPLWHLPDGQSAYGSGSGSSGSATTLSGGMPCLSAKLCSIPQCSTMRHILSGQYNSISTLRHHWHFSCPITYSTTDRVWEWASLYPVLGIITK